MANPLKFPALVFRLLKGSPLTAEEGDNNLKAIRDSWNQLASLLSSALNPDGTLKNDAVAKAFMPFFANFLPPLGSARWSPVVEPATVTLPTNGAVWLEANGQEVLISDYPKLNDYYVANGFTFGGAASGNFKLPDMSGRVMLGRKPTTINQKQLSSMTRSGSIVTAVKADHGFAAGQDVTIEGADQAEYNHTFTILTATDSSFTFEVVGTPTTPATGTAIMATSQSGGFSAGDKGGQESVAMTVAELPAHTHQNPVTVYHVDDPFTNVVGAANTGKTVIGVADLTPASTGGSQPHDNMMPYFGGVFYILAGYKIDGAWVTPVASLP